MDLDAVLTANDKIVEEIEKQEIVQDYDHYVVEAKIGHWATPKMLAEADVSGVAHIDSKEKSEGWYILKDFCKARAKAQMKKFGALRDDPL